MWISRKKWESIQGKLDELEKLNNLRMAETEELRKQIAILQKQIQTERDEVESGEVWTLTNFVRSII